MYKARAKYSKLETGRSQFLDTAIECSELTLPYLVTRDENYKGKRTLLQPYQSVGAKAVVTLAATFFSGRISRSRGEEQVFLWRCRARVVRSPVACRRRSYAVYHLFGVVFRSSTIF